MHVATTAFLAVSAALALAFLGAGPGRAPLRVLGVVLGAAVLAATVGALQVPSSAECRALLDGLGVATSPPGSFSLPCLDLLVGCLAAELVLLDLLFLAGLVLARAEKT